MTVSSAALAGLLERLDELESRNAIQDLVTDYCQGFDKKNVERFLSIWWDDCVWDIGGKPFGDFSGLTEIERAYHDLIWPTWRETHHLTTNLRLWFEEKDRARGECDVDVMGASPTNELIVVGATYHDQFERRNGVWKILLRKVQMHFYNPVSEHDLRLP